MCDVLHNVLVSCWSTIGPDRSTAFVAVAAWCGHGAPVAGAVTYATVVTEAATQAYDVKEKDYDTRQHDEPTSDWESHSIVAIVVNNPSWNHTKITLKQALVVVFLNSPLTLKAVQGHQKRYEHDRLNRDDHHAMFERLN